jgi:Protein of unknown function (DUF3025)
VRWDPTFFRKSPLYWPIAEAASKLERFDDWPAPSDLALLFSPHLGDPPVRFDLASPKPRRRPAAADARYDARIAVERVVPTRARSWHDLLNALVWASFPRAKLALHTRQHRMIEARLGADLRLPGARTKEQDAVAMLDEGGVVLLRGRQSCAVIFGHAIYEGLACDGPPNVRGAAYVVSVDDVPVDPRARVAVADAALAEILSRAEPIGREDFETIVVGPHLAPLLASTRAG